MKVIFDQEKCSLIAEYLHHSGVNNRSLSPAEHNRLFALGDGYGKQTVEQLKANHLTWDWSHIRDSSNEALENIYQELKKIVD